MNANKPQLSGTEVRPWMAFVAVLALLCCSLGANAYLGLIAIEARKGQRAALAKLRPSAA